MYCQRGIALWPSNVAKSCNVTYVRLILQKEQPVSDTGKMQHEKFMQLALRQAKEALDAREFPVGCIIVENGNVVASGARLNSSVELCELDHAEIVALRSLQAYRPDIDLSRVTVYSTMEPCLMCYATLIVNGVRRIVYAYEDAMGGGTNLQLQNLSPLYRNIDMEITRHILRRESLELFQRFFQEEDNTYLKDTLLAEYTLQQ